MVVAGCRGGGRGKRHASGTWSLHEASAAHVSQPAQYPSVTSRPATHPAIQGRGKDQLGV